MAKMGRKSKKKKLEHQFNFQTCYCSFNTCVIHDLAYKSTRFSSFYLMVHFVFWYWIFLIEMVSIELQIDSTSLLDSVCNNSFTTVIILTQHVKHGHIIGQRIGSIFVTVNLQHIFINCQFCQSFFSTLHVLKMVNSATNLKRKTYVTSFQIIHLWTGTQRGKHVETWVLLYL